MAVPFFDLKQQAEQLWPAMEPKLREWFLSCGYSGGHKVEEFEKNFAAKVGTRFAVGVGSGTDALHLALSSCGPGDEIITVPNTFAATVEAATYTRAKTVFCDVNPDTLLMDPRSLAERVTDRTRIIIPVHLFGNVCDMDAISAVAKERRIMVVEDACQAVNATYKGKQAGSHGAIGCFSFYPSKNLAAAGEAGAVTTNDQAIAELFKELRSHGGPANVHRNLGYNYRMDGIQAIIVDTKLEHLDAWTDRRRNIAAQYAEQLKGVEGVKLPVEQEGSKHAYHLFVVQAENREGLKAHLKEKGIGFAMHYPKLVYRHEAFKKFAPKEGCPVAEAAESKILSLPMYPEMTDSQVAEVCECVKSFYEKQLR